MDVITDIELDKALLDKVASIKTILSQKDVRKPRKKKPPRPLPRRKPSIVIPPRKKVYITPDKLQCKTCSCYSKEEPYSRDKKIRQCVYNVPTLYELSAHVLDTTPVPAAFSWEIEKVIEWLVNEVELPQYQECMFANRMNGRRLLMLEDPSKLPMMNIKYFDDIKKITSAVRKLFGLDFIRFARSIGLPGRRPMVNVTAFKARTGPSCGIRQNWTYSDVIRWMKILGPKPTKMDHWDLVWYLEPDFPKTLFGKIPARDLTDVEPVPRCTEEKKVDENLVPRKFRLHKDPPIQMIWMEKQLTSRQVVEMLLPKKKVIQYPIRKTLLPQIDSLTGLIGKDLILAKRKLPTPKFIPDHFFKKNRGNNKEENNS